jgi:hypothetical protein
MAANHENALAPFGDKGCRIRLIVRSSIVPARRTPGQRKTALTNQSVGHDYRALEHALMAEQRPNDPGNFSGQSDDHFIRVSAR